MFGKRTPVPASTPRGGTPSSSTQWRSKPDSDDDREDSPILEGKGKEKADGNEEDADKDVEEEAAVTMADDEFTAQSQHQAQVKANLHLLTENFTPDQAARYALYREIGLKQANVKRVLSSQIGPNIPSHMLQLVGGTAKVFVGEMVEKAREIQNARGETGPLAPEHIREAYRLYVQETGRVGPAPPLRGKRLFVR